MENMTGEMSTLPKKVPYSNHFQRVKKFIDIQNIREENKTGF